MKPTRRTVLIATASSGLTVSAGGALFLAAQNKSAPLPLAQRMPKNITLRFNILTTEAGTPQPVSSQSQ